VRVYELMFIVVPTEPDEAVDAIIEQLRTVAEDRGATVAKIDKMGRRKLAYPIRVSPKTHTEGNYVVLTLEGSGAEIFELERRLRVTETVIRHITVRIDEDLKRAEKFKAKRAARAASGGGRRRERSQTSTGEMFTDDVEEETTSGEEES
jgi:small subunit ribosomal protein S6